MRRRGFTLAEALLVAAVLAILVALFFPVFYHPHGYARQTTCLNNQRQIAIALMMYAQDNGGTLFPDPVKKAWPAYLFAYNEPNIYDCPTKKGKGNNGNPEYGFNANLFNRLYDVEDAAGTLLTADLGTAGMTGNYAVTSQNSAAPHYFETVLDPRHAHTLACSAVDGHVAIITVPKGTLLAPALQKADLHWAVTVKAKGPEQP